VKYYFESSVPEWTEKPIREAFGHWTAVENSYISFEETSSSTSAMQEFSSHLDTLMGQRVKRVIVSALLV